MIQRNYYLNRLIRNMWNGEIKVITGIRRCGKSVLLFELFDEYLRNHGTDATQIIKIELDQRRYYKYRNPITLCEYVEQLVLGQQDKKLYLFIDEVQLTAKVIDQENGGIEVTIYDMLNELKAYKNLDVYVTGSNSKGLSKDIATEFRGRATQIHVFPLCFEEFYSAVGGDERKALDTYMLYGGMPRLLAMQDDKDKKDYLSSLYTELYVKDIVERNGIEREDILNDILNFLASQISSLTNPTNIANAIASMKNEKVNPALVSNYVQDIVDSFLISVAKRYDVKGKTYFNYLDIFKRLFITDNQPPFSSGIRSSVRIKQAEKRHFSDPSLACALLKATPAGLMGDLETLGSLFEALCERDLRIYAESFGASLYHYQDYKNQEIDAVIELPDGQWCAFEIKLGANQIDAAAANLLEIKEQISEDPKGKPPAVLCVLCGMSNAAYQRPDGVFVVPITALKN